MVATELVKPIMYAFLAGMIVGILLTIFAIINVVKLFWEKITGIFNKKKGEQ